MASRVLLLVSVLLFTACAGSLRTTSPDASAINPSAVASAASQLTEEVKSWCASHVGGPGADQFQVEDMAVRLGVIPGAKTREDISGRWAGKSQADLVQDPTYVAACVAAFATQPLPSPSA